MRILLENSIWRHHFQIPGRAIAPPAGAHDCEDITGPGSVGGALFYLPWWRRNFTWGKQHIIIYRKKWTMYRRHRRNPKCTYVCETRAKIFIREQHNDVSNMGARRKFSWGGQNQWRLKKLTRFRRAVQKMTIFSAHLRRNRKFLLFCAILDWIIGYLWRERKFWYFARRQHMTSFF